jgi:hypothetical protein
MHQAGECPWQESELKNFLLSEIQDLQPKPLLLLVDALDECSDAHVREVVEFLENLSVRATRAKTALNICLSSRHFPCISMSRMAECKELVLEATEKHKRDIDVYTHDKLRRKDSEI